MRARIFRLRLQLNRFYANGVSMSASPVTFPQMPVYLFYGNQSEAILKARDQVVERFLLPETRNENLTEYISHTQTATVKLVDLFPEIAGDMATISFIAEAPKVVVVTNPAELLGTAGGATRKSKKTKPGVEEQLCSWIAEELPQTGHYLILLVMEDEAAGRELNERAPLYQTVLKTGFVQGYRDQKAFFRIEETLLARDVRGCLQAVRDLWRPGKGDMAVYNSLVRTLRYLMQANIMRDKGIPAASYGRSGGDPTAGGRFPGDKQRSLAAAHPAVQKKYLSRPVYRTGELLSAYEGMLDVYRAMRPRPGDVYVPDAQGLMEQTLVRLMTSIAPRQ